MKKIIFYFTIVLVAILGSCGDSFLDRENLYQFDESSYYSSPEQVAEALTAVYSALPSEHGYSSEILISELMSDDRFSGGGPEDLGAQGIDEFQLNKEDQYDLIWAESYTGIFRANMLISHFDQAEFEDENQKNQMLGETHFLRAYFYFRLAKFFGNVPLITDPTEDTNKPKAETDAIYAQIASDLKKAIDIMPSDTYASFTAGHATKWAAEALMARVFLFYTGVYSKDSMPLEGGSVSKANVQNWLIDLIDNSGHALVPDFRNIWPYAHDTANYAYARDNSLEWVGEGINNTETVFAIKYGPYADWGDLSYGNQVPLFFGLRGLNNSPIGKGWGWGTVNPQLWDSYETGDTRQAGSIINVNNADEGSEFLSKYQPGKNNFQQETGYFNKKYVPISEISAEDGKWYGMYYLIYGGSSNFQHWNIQDQIIIRFADVLLMAAELECTNAQQYLDMVRTRAGLSSVSATLDNIKLERRHELAFEGLRYHDLLRWHDIETAFSVVKNIPILNSGASATYTAKYRPETKGFLPIPPSQIRISGGILTQNPGW